MLEFLAGLAVLAGGLLLMTALGGIVRSRVYPDCPRTATPTPAMKRRARLVVVGAVLLFAAAISLMAYFHSIDQPRLASAILGVGAFIMLSLLNGCVHDPTPDADEYEQFVREIDDQPS